MLGSAELPLAVILWVVAGVTVLLTLYVVAGVGARFYEAYCEWKLEREQLKAKQRFMDITTGARK